MKTILGVTAMCFCLLTVAGCSSQTNKQVAEKEVSRMESDENMVVSDWFRKGYFVHENYILNSLLLKMLGLFTVLWLAGSIYFIVWCFQNDGGTPGPDELLQQTPIPYLIGYVLMFVIWVVFWFIAGIVISIVSPSSYIPFDFAGFLTLVGINVAIVAYFSFLLINKVKTKSPVPEQAATPNVIINTKGPSSRHKRVLRAMLKALFVAVASAVGAKIGGWIGGVLVFVISAGMSAFFEMPPSEADHSQRNDPQT
jgi:hypothetical protein